MRTKSTNRIIGILIPAILMLASSCVKLEIIGTRSGDEFVAGERILFQARTEEARRSQVQWIVDGSTVATGESFATANLSIGWHHVVAELTVNEKTVKDTVDVQVIS